MTAMMTRNELRRQVMLAEKELARRVLFTDLRPAEPYGCGSVVRFSKHNIVARQLEVWRIR